MEFKPRSIIFTYLKFHTSLAILLTLQFILTTSTTTKAQKNLDHHSPPICIIGGGISGLNLGHLLLERGHPVLVLEQFDRVGGKIWTFRHKNEIQVEVGPVAFTPGHKNVIKMAGKYGLTPIPFNDSRVLAFEPYSGAVFPARFVINTLRSPMLKAAEKYLDERALYNLDFPYVNLSPSIFEPISSWLDHRNLGILKPFFRFSITQQGYGALEDTPVLYALKLVDRTMLVDVALNPQGGLLILKEGLDTLAQRMAQSLNIKLNEEVVQILRESDPQKVVNVTTWNHQTQSEMTYQCKKVIMAFAPLAKQMEKIVKDLSDEEKWALTQVKVHKYTTAVHHIPNWEEAIYASVGAGISNALTNQFMGDGNVLLFAKQSFKKLDNIYSSYSWIRGQFTDLPTTIDFELIDKKLNATLARISADNLNTEKVTTLVQPTQRLPYFPHVDTSSLRQGFYEKFHKIQGNGGLFYGTTLLGFETMDSAIQMTHDFVNTYGDIFN